MPAIKCFFCLRSPQPGGKCWSRKRGWRQEDNRCQSQVYAETEADKLTASQIRGCFFFFFFRQIFSSGEPRPSSRETSGVCKATPLGAQTSRAQVEGGQEREGGEGQEGGEQEEEGARLFCLSFAVTQKLLWRAPARHPDRPSPRARVRPVMSIISPTFFFIPLKQLWQYNQTIINSGRIDSTGRCARAHQLRCLSCFGLFRPLLLTRASEMPTFALFRAN